MACIAKRRNRYIIDFYDNQGNRKWKTLPAGTTKAKAKDALRDLEDQLAKGIYLPDRKIPFFKDVANDWLEYKKRNLRASTWSVYEGHTRNHFSDLENLKINLITTAKIEKFISARQNEMMNISTLRKILVTLGQIMNYAVRHKYIDHNPVKEAERPRDQGDQKDASVKVLTPKGIKLFIESTDNQKYKILFKLAIMSGARQGELLGLQWSDIDWKNNQIHIQRTFNNDQWYDVKTRTSNRKIDIGPSVMSDLKKWKIQCMPNKNNLVFPNRYGNPINPSNLRNRHFYPALKKAKLCSSIRFHDLRHSYASLLIEQGENIKYIQSQLGHSSPTVTLNVYAHLMKSVNQDSAKRLEETIFK